MCVRCLQVCRRLTCRTSPPERFIYVLSGRGGKVVASLLTARPPPPKKKNNNNKHNKNQITPKHNTYAHFLPRKANDFHAVAGPPPIHPRTCCRRNRVVYRRVRNWMRQKNQRDGSKIFRFSPFPQYL